MTITAKHTEDQILTIFLEGAIDSATAPEAEKQIMEIYHAHTAKAGFGTNAEGCFVF